MKLFSPITRNGSTSPASPVLFAQGFRIFFSLAGIWATLAMTLWLGTLNGVAWMGRLLPDSLYHGHEMVFGFTAAAAAGFMLTATPVWSKTPPLSGRPLQALFLAWLLGRVGTLFPWHLHPWFAALADGIFLCGFLIFITPTLWFTGNPVHRIFPILLGLLAMGDLLFHGEALQLTTRTAHTGLLLGQNAIIFFLVMTGGHILPMFTRDALRTNGEEITFPVSRWLEGISATTLTLLVAADLFFPDSPEAGWVFLVAGLVQALRLSRWHGHKTLQHPLLWVLHLGYLWLVAGLALRGVARLTGLLDETSALHALSVGAMGLFTQGIMARIALTHTGRPLRVSAFVVAAFGLITGAAVLRVFAAPWHAGALWLSAGLWIIAFMLFCIVFLPVLSTPRPDGKAG
ncbi:MAG: NnrS family protein [Magnetococcales bacterium]|nr:NnrS family protein [Magnetococcales bacterium]